MFDDVLVVYTAWDAAKAFNQLAVPVCRKSGYDDVLPDPPEYLKHQQYTILRAPKDGSDGDASNSFVGGLQHDGMVVLSSKQLPHALFLPSPGGGCSVSLAVLQEATARQHKQQEKQQREQQLDANQLHTQRSRQQSSWGRQRQQASGPVQLVPIALHMDQQFLQDVAAAVVQHNKAVKQEQLKNENAQQQQQQGPSLQDLIQRQQQLMRQGTSQHQQQQQQVPRVIVTPLLLQTLQAAAAATAIQSSWRAHRSRLLNKIAERALCNRAAVAIQRAWRAFILKQRLRLLSTVSAAWQAGQRLFFSSIMCVDVASRRLVEAAAESSRLGQGMFPEQRLRFIIDNEGSVALVDTAESSSTGSISNGRTVAETDGIAGQGSQHISSILNNNNSCSSGGVSRSSAVPAVRVGLPKWLGVDIPVISAAAAAKILEDQVWFEPFGRADAGKLLEIGCDAKDLLAPSLIATSGLLHPTDIAQLVTFKSPQQAAARAALLAALTYSVKAQASCRLLSVQDSPLGASYRSMTGCGASSTTGSTHGGTAGSARVASEAGTAAGVYAARVAARAAAGGVKFMQGVKKGAKLTSSSINGGGSAAAVSSTTAEAGAGGGAPCAAILAATSAAAPAAATSASFAAAAAGVGLNGNDGGSVAAESGSSTAKIAARTAAAYEERLAAEAATAEETAMQALKVLELDNPEPLHQLPLLPVKPTETLAAAVAETATEAAAAGGASGSLRMTAAGLASGAVLVPGSIKLETHLFHKLPHLQKLAAGMDAELMFAAATAAAAAGADSVKPTQAVASIAANRAAAGVTAHASAGVVWQNQGSETVIDVATQTQTAVQLAVNRAECITKVKQEQVEAFKSKLAADAAAAAATADAELAAKQHAVQVVRAAVAEGNAIQEPRSTSSAHCPALGCWPESTAAAAELVRWQKQQQQQVAAAAAAALKEKELQARQELMRQQAASKARAQVDFQMQAHALQQKLLQEEEQQQQAARSRVALLREFRKSGKAAAVRRQEVAAALNRQCNMFSKHLKRGEVAVVRAASSKAAAGHTAELRQTNNQAAALAQQQRQDMDSTCAAKGAQERQAAKLAFQAVKNVTEMERAARRATVAAQRLHAEQMAQSVGPAGGVWGSAKPDGVLKSPLKVALVGTVDSRSATWPPGV